ncbi:MAG TPA: multidrug efflux SMR transporter [Acidimicrobiales bacterium]|nr:multidrug efflux SMR transporter [Acidimicrobiales bacterium]
MTAWLTLLAAGLLEVGFAASLKPSEGFTRLGPSVAVVVFGVAAVVVLTRALESVPVATAYAVFTAIGTLGTTAVAAVAFDESLTPLKVVSLVLVLAGVAGLRATG